MCLKWADDLIKKFTCFDYALVKISVFSFTLMLAKLWPGILSLNWYCYGSIFAVISVYFLVRILKR